MDLTELRSVYDNAVTQLEVLDASLLELLRRRLNAIENGSMIEFNYLEFKITILQGVINMYEQYRDRKWTQLQKESVLALQEVIYGDVTTAPLTPPLSPIGSPQGHSSPSQNMDWSENDFHIHMIPAPLTPIRDTDDLLLTPPGSPQIRDRYYFGRNLMNSSLTELPVTRDL